MDSTGSKWELLVYLNLKTSKQGKHLKLALQRVDGSVGDNLHDNLIWLELNPKLRDLTYPPLGAKVDEQRLMEPTLERLMACPTPARDLQAHGKPRPQRPLRQDIAPSAPTDFVDLEDDGDDEPEDDRILEMRICEHNAPFMLGHLYNMNNSQPKYYSIWYTSPFTKDAGGSLLVMLCIQMKSLKCKISRPFSKVCGCLVARFLRPTTCTYSI